MNRVVVGFAIALGLFLSAISAAAKFDAKATAAKALALIDGYSLGAREESGEIIGDAASKRGFELLIEDLDRDKLCFTADDVSSLRTKWNDKLDDELRVGSLTAMREMLELLVERCKEREKITLELTNSTPDFSVVESYDADRKNRRYLSNVQELTAAVRQRVKYEWLQLRLTGKSDADCVQTIRKRSQLRLKSLEKLAAKEEVVFELFVTALMRGLDPHSSYLAPRSADSFRLDLGGSITGIGAKLSNLDGALTVEAVIKGGPAADAGTIKVKDIISAVAQEADGAWVDVSAMELDEAVDLIRGKSGSVVRLKVLSPGDPTPKEISLTRRAVTLDEIVAKGRMETVDGTRVGLITVPSFYRDFSVNQGKDKNVTKDVKKIIETLKQDNADILVVDLRNNGGGALPDAIEMTGLFIDVGPVLQTKDAQKDVEVLSDESPGTLWDKPLVVLTNVHSASASEIFAGALKAYHRALIIGDDSTHGKGTVQTAMDLGEGRGSIAQFFGTKEKASGILKFTISQFYLPDGMSTQEKGVTSHVVLPSLFSVLDGRETTLPHHLPFDKIAAAPKLAPVDGFWKDDFAARLAEKSKSRRATDSAWLEYVKKREVIENQLKLKQVPLEESAFRKYFGEAKESALEDELEPSPNRPDPHLTEALKISRDYLELTRE